MDADDDVFEMRAALTGSRGTRGRSDKDATAESILRRRDDDDEGQQTGKRPDPGGVARFAAVVAADDEDGDGDSEANYNQAVEFNAKRSEARSGGDGGGSSRNAPRRSRNTCPICQFGVQGPAGHAGTLHESPQDGQTREERDRGIELWKSSRGSSRERREAAEAGQGPRAPRPPGRPQEGRARKPVAPPYRETDDALEPLELAPQAKTCSNCQARFSGRAQLIEHMWSAHGVRAVPRPRTRRTRTCAREGDGGDGGSIPARVHAGTMAVAMVPHGGFGGLSSMPSPATGLISNGAPMSLGDGVGDDILQNVYERLALLEQENKLQKLKIAELDAQVHDSERGF